MTKKEVIKKFLTEVVKQNPKLFLRSDNYVDLVLLRFKLDVFIIDLIDEKKLSKSIAKKIPPLTITAKSLKRMIKKSNVQT
jgi:hypothetical protein